MPLAYTDEPARKVPGQVTATNKICPCYKSADMQYIMSTQKHMQGSISPVAAKDNAGIVPSWLAAVSQARSSVVVVIAMPEHYLLLLVDA